MALVRFMITLKINIGVAWFHTKKECVNLIWATIQMIIKQLEWLVVIALVNLKVNTTMLLLGTMDILKNAKSYFTLVFI